MRSVSLRIARVLAFLGVALLAFGQATDGNLVGNITDPTGATVPGANLQLENVATGLQYRTVTGADGSYRFNNVPVGTYKLTVTAQGFTPSTVQNINVELNKTATVNTALQLGQVATTVEVIEAAAQIDTTTAQVGTTFQAREAIDTPNAALARGVLNLSLLSAGVAGSGGLGLGEGPSVGGQRPRNNNFNVEGVDNNRKDVTGPTVFLPSEAIAEFSILQNQYSAEFGNGTGGQFNSVIRGGTNAVHGSLYEYMQNRNLNAIDQDLQRQGYTKNPRFDQNVLGGSVGGPVIKNKLFYYGLFQYTPIGQATTPAGEKFAPTAEGYSMLASIPGVSSANLDVLKKYLPAAPAASSTTSVGGVDVPLGILPVAAPSFQNDYEWLTSVDYNISDRDQLRGRYVDDLTSGFDPSTLSDLPAFYAARRTTTKLLAVSEFHNFSPTLNNELRLGYNKYHDTIPVANITFPEMSVFPDLVFPNDLLMDIGPYNSSPSSTIINTYQVVDNVTWTKGRHSWKFGFDGRRYIAPQGFTQRTRGEYQYSSLGRYLLDLSPDLFAERNAGSAQWWGNQWNYAGFAQDNFKLRQNLTLNLGVRYEYKGIPASNNLQALNAIASVPGLIDFRAPRPQKTNFVPRVGIAYSPGTSGRTSIRAGFGLAYDKDYDNLGLTSKPPELESTVDTNVHTTVPGFLAQGGILPNGAIPAYGLGPKGTGSAFTDPQAARDATSAFIYDDLLPYSIQWNVGVQHVFANDYTLEVRYLGTRGVHLPTQNHPNVGAVVNSSRFLPTYLAMPSADTLAGLQYTLGDLQGIDPILPQWAAAGFDNTIITAFPFRGNSIYHGLATELTRRFARGLLFKGAYTWSHNIDDSTADLFSTYLSPRRPEDFQNMRAERSSSFLDRRHRFTMNWVYDVPWYRGSSNWFMKNIVGNYTVSGTYIYESPQYMTVQSVRDSNLNLDSATDRAILNLGGVPNTGSGVNPIDRNGSIVTMGSGATVAYVAQNPNAQYIQAGDGALANSGRQTLPSRPINNWDFGVKKAFSFTESKRLELGAQFYNLFNHPQFTPGYVNTVVFHNSNDTALRAVVNPTSAAFNRPDLVFASNARVIQVIGRIQF